MIQRLKQSLLTLILIGTIAPAMAQSGTSYTVRDFEVWTGAQLKYKLSDNWQVGLEQQQRLKDDASTVDAYFTELTLKRKLGDNFSVGFGSRYVRNNDTEGKIQGYENRFRWNADLGYKHSINDLSLKYRLRYQSRNEIGIEDEPKTVFRLKAGADYNINNWKFDPKIAAELFNGISTSEGFYKARFTLGTDYKTKKIGEFGVYYRMERELTGLYPKTTNIAGFSYAYTLKKKKNDK